MSDFSRLIGTPYRLGADGSDGAIDCIHLVYTVLGGSGIATPPFNPHWYEADIRAVVRDLRAWGNRVDYPQYDGDVVLLPDDGWAFAVTWQTGILYINTELQQVAWSPLCALRRCRSYRTKSS